MSPYIFMVLNGLQITFIVIILHNFLHRLLKLPRDALYPDFTRERGASRTRVMWLASYFLVLALSAPCQVASFLLLHPLLLLHITADKIAIF